MNYRKDFVWTLAAVVHRLLFIHPVSPEASPGDLGTFLGWLPPVRPTRSGRFRYCPQGGLRPKSSIQDGVFGNSSSPLPWVILHSVGQRTSLSPNPLALCWRVFPRRPGQEAALGGSDPRRQWASGSPRRHLPEQRCSYFSAPTFINGGLSVYPSCTSQFKCLQRVSFLSCCVIIQVC